MASFEDQPLPLDGSVPDQPQLPQGDVRNQPEASGGWTQWLRDPSNRAFLMSMGTQLMMPTWGGPMVQLAQGLAAGQEAQSGTQKMQLDLDTQREAALRQQSQAALDRATRLRVAEIGANSGTSTDEVGLRARLTHQFFNTLVRDNPLAGPERRTRAELHQQAIRMADEALRGGGAPAAATPGPGTTAPRVPGAPSTPSTPSAPRLRPGELPQNTTIGPDGVPRRTSAPPTIGPAPGSEAYSRNSFDQWLARPGARELLQNPTFRTRLMQQRRDWAQFIEEESRRGTGGR